MFCDNFVTGSGSELFTPFVELAERMGFTTVSKEDVSKELLQHASR